MTQNLTSPSSLPPEFDPRLKYEPYFILGIVLCLILAGLSYCHRPVQDRVIYSSDSLNYYKDQWGREVAAKKVVVATVEDLKQNLVESDTLIKLMKRQLSRATDNITVLKQQVAAAGSLPSTATGRDTVRRDDTIYVYPEYTVHREDSLVDIDITANSDFVHYSFKATNYATIEQKWRKKGFLGLGGRELFIEVGNSNPYIHTERLQSFKATKKPAVFWQVVKYVGTAGFGYWLGRQ